MESRDLVSVSQLCIRYFLWSFAGRSFFKIRFKKMIVQNLAVQKGQWLNFLCCYVVCEMQRIICPLRHLKFILNSTKNEHAPMKPQRVISAASTLQRTTFELFFQEFCCESHTLIQKWWESAKKFLFWETKWNHLFFSKCFSNHSVKTPWWSSFFSG